MTPRRPATTRGRREDLPGIINEYEEEEKTEKISYMQKAVLAKIQNYDHIGFWMT